MKRNIGRPIKSVWVNDDGQLVKKCCGCKKIRPVREFARNKGNTNQVDREGHDAWCRSCQSNYFQRRGKQLREDKKTRVRGHVDIYVENTKTHQEVDHVRVSNLFLDGGYTNLAKILAGDDAVDLAVEQMQFGTGADAVDAADTFLSVPIAPMKTIDPITGVDYPTSYSVSFEAVLADDEANGFPISEAGLLAGDGTLMARTVFATQTKTPDYQFRFVWTISC